MRRAGHRSGPRTRRRLARLIAGALALLAGCAARPDPDPAPDPARPHHTAQGFRNTTAVGAIDTPLSRLLRWRWEALRDGLPPPPRAATPVVAPDLDGLRANAGGLEQPAVTWIGHATTLVQADGLDVLTDPVFSDRASPVPFAGPRRAQPPGVALAELPPVDVVLISHNHYDHLDRASVVALDGRSKGRTLFLVPLGLRDWMQAQGIRHVVELDWWETHRVGAVTFQLVPVQHWSARSLGDRNRTLWGGWVARGPDLHWYFSGDSGYSSYFGETRARGGPVDLALLAIGAYEPRWFMQAQHMDPAEAVQAHHDLGAGRSIAIHWGTFALTDEPLDQPPRDLARARHAAGLADDAFATLRIGETRRLPARGARQSAP
ncbi:MBL fold metallo-hydrolase [Ramlibacter sp. MAH-25]|uniref:MBL fold metallo-hydrolase n=1 Tax=Ramlibacter pinisoli TaxID=2682844 RepID=A0A6N8IVF9_9BURK|nr:MBL fold metallo-hydrolase [Ramlibacter sp. CGMCC 1.13660]MVQ30555.1 MBL fold metallo-hydrolase [Ramlibacter pinisoli]